MNRSIRLVFASAVLVALLSSLHPAVQAQTRLARPPQDYYPPEQYNQPDLYHPLLPAGASALPSGSVLVLEMDSQLKSNRSRVGDRFQAHVVVPVSDASGRVVIPNGTIIEGHVISVRPAKWRRRSGIIAIQFDSVRAPDGRLIPVRATLTGADADERRRLDEEGNLKGGPLLVRDVVFVGGGAVAGAALGWIAGSALAGGGAGAAIGLTATLLMKGKDVSVEPRQRIGMRLVQPLPLNVFTYRQRDPYLSDYSRQPTSPYPPISYPPRPRPTPRPNYPYNPYYPTYRVPTTNRPRQVSNLNLVALQDARVERSTEGLVRVFVTAQTPTAGWRIYTNHEVTGNGMDVRVRGVPPAQGATQVRSYPAAPIITVQDRNVALRRVVIHGSNGDIAIAVGTQVGAYVGRLNPNSRFEPVGGFTGSRPSTSRPPLVGVPTTGYPTPRPIRPTPRPTTRPPVYYPPAPPTGTPSSGGGSASELARRAVNSLEVAWRSYANSLGYEVNLADGSLTRFIGSRQPTQEQMLLLNKLSALRDSVRTLRSDVINPSVRANSARRVQEDLAETEQMWQVVPLGQDINRYWRIARDDIQALLSATLR